MCSGAASSSASFSTVGAGPACATPGARVGVLSRGLLRAPHLGTLLGTDHVVASPKDHDASQLDYVAAWGKRPTAARAEDFAKRHGLPLLRLEDGFLRSMGLGVHGAAALSMVLDDVGIYYDCTTPSRLERILAGQDSASEQLHAPDMRRRGEAAMAAIVKHRLSKYNQAPVAPSLPEEGDRPRVLVVDQTAGDMSLELGGLPGKAPLAPLLQAAVEEHSTAAIYVKRHPDVATGKKRSALGPAGLPAHVRELSAPCNALELLSQFDHVYVGTSQVGFEALLLGKRVTCLGAPFYAGWGLTDDRSAIARRSHKRSLVEVFIAAYLLYARYVDPATGRPGELEDVIAHFARQRQMHARNAKAYFCFGFSSWKRDFVRQYLASPDGTVRFARGAWHARLRGFDANSVAVVWGQRDGPAVRNLVRDTGATMARMEDGFLRSVGLGSDLTTPASLVVDERGLYYDPSVASDLEAVLATAEFTDADLARAATLRRTLVERRVSKYGFGTRQAIGTQARPDQPRLLVVGQVESDASIRLGCQDITTNLALARAVRREHPEAFVIFKAHPDVVSGNRKRGDSPLDAIAEVCDEVVTTARLHDCLDVVSGVHTMTSLVGFEALLRGLPVTTYGQPFYAGWGLTTDRNPLPRRVRRLSLDALVTGALLRYPRYVHPQTGEFVEAETIVDYLATQQQPSGGRSPWVLRQLARFGRALVGHARVR